MKIITPILFATLLATTSIKARTEINLNELYKELHSNPELSYKEVNTSKKLAKIIQTMGFKVTQNFGGYGVVALLENGIGKTIMIRADMDALPIKEQTGAPYSSNVKSFNEVGSEVFTMHACGHDVHMSTLIGTAESLIKAKDKWQGNLLLVLQPAEEVSGGARKMIEEGLFKKFPRPDFNLALHVSADLPAGNYYHGLEFGGGSYYFYISGNAYPPGGSNTYTFDLTGALLPGDHDVSIMADLWDYVIESDETNNSLASVYLTVFRRTIISITGLFFFNGL